MIVAFMAGTVFGAVGGCTILALAFWALKEMNEDNDNETTNQN